jgi:plastocyanin
MRRLFVCTLFILASCGDDTTTPPSTFDLAAPTSVSGDMATPPGADLAGAAFPATAAVTVGPGNTLTFSPATVDIAAGGTVTWTWAAANTMPHDVTSSDQPPKFSPSPIQTSGSFSHTFATAGSYPYFCTVHGQIMSGTVMVH